MGTNRRVEEVVIPNYERLGKIFEAKPRKGAKKLTKRDLARRGAPNEEFDIVLFDESHALKNLTSLRAKFSVKLYGSASDLTDWPEVNRIIHWVKLDCEAQHLYKLAWKEFKNALEGIGTLSKQQTALIKSEAVIRLRQKSSLLKVEDSIELCLELLDNGRQVAISCEFLATMDAMEGVL
jgi:hypothetical protein